ncbi:2-phospho-L-lactate guanylyltransferase [Oerskovia sp. KBS0722]|uniref:2-phospho-L-lactate guanylyltransferase n=1 Tax=Oerskovia sp. KBS0722 TaxID=1179673 RepID=UPI00110D5572|nr:2-phospho-L-lactate guanylyltransferase [Oerskovia sp. KBS0722]QDW61217.1 2-phospho-L-lactate guanylyltransferase [Oerskovia sp. KBS0722]
MTPDGATHPAVAGAGGASPARQRVVAVVPLRDGSSGKSRLATVLDPAERSRLIATLARHVVGTLLASESVERVLVVTSDPRFTWRALGSLVEPVPPPMDDAPPTVTDPPAEGDAPAGRGRPAPPPTVTGSPAEGDGDSAEGDGPGRLQIVLQPASRPGLNAALDVGREIVASLAADPGTSAEGATGRPVRLLVAHADLPALTTEDIEVLVAADAPVVVATDRARSGTNLLVLDADAPFTFRFGVGSLAAHLAEADRRGVRAAVVQRTGTAVDLDTLDDWSELPADVRARDELVDLHRAMDRAHRS